MGQVDHLGPGAHVPERDVADSCAEFWLVQGPARRSLKLSVPPRDRMAIQYVAPARTAAAETGTSAHALAFGDAREPEVSSDRGAPLASE